MIFSNFNLDIDMESLLNALGFVKTEYNYEGKLQLLSWKDYHCNGEYYITQDSQLPSDGVVNVLLPINDEDDISESFTPASSAAIQFLLNHETDVQGILLQALVDNYPNVLEAFCHDEELPVINSVADLKSNIVLNTIHIVGVEKDGYAYLGFQFGCTWDDEHGAGVMMHKDRIVNVGGADTSFLEWIAQRDGGSMVPVKVAPKKPEPIPEEVIKQFEAMMKAVPLKEESKPWWKFW